MTASHTSGVIPAECGGENGDLGGTGSVFSSSSLSKCQMTTEQMLGKSRMMDELNENVKGIFNFIIPFVPKLGVCMEQSCPRLV